MGHSRSHSYPVGTASLQRLVKRERTKCLAGGWESSEEAKIRPRIRAGTRSGVR